MSSAPHKKAGAKMRLKIPRGIPSTVKPKLRQAHKMLRKMGIDFALMRNEALEHFGYDGDIPGEDFFDLQNTTYEKVPGPAPAYMYAEVRVPFKQRDMDPRQRFLWFNHDLKGISNTEVHKVMTKVFGTALSWNKSNRESIRVTIRKPATKAGKKTVKKPAKKAVKKPAKKPTKKPAKKTSKKTVKKPAKKTSKKTVKKPAKKTSKKTVKKPAKKTIKRKKVTSPKKKPAKKTRKSTFAKRMSARKAASTPPAK